MPEAATSDDTSDAHGTFAASLPTDKLSTTVKINGQPVVLLGTTYADHVDTKGTKHEDITVTGSSSSVKINGEFAARKGDLLSCGGKINTGSSNVFIGG